jgi:hypothetical protein
MTALQTLQQHFQNYILQQELDFLAEVRGPDKEFAIERLDIYREGYVLRLLEVLTKNFPILAKWLGEEVFEQIGQEYIALYPSQFFTVGYYGHELADFIARQNASWAAVGGDLARFSWTLNQAIESADKPVANRQDLLAVPQQHWADIRIQLHPSVQQLKLSSNAPEIWKKLDKGESAPTAQIIASPQVWVIWRKGIQAFFAPQTESEAWMLATMAAGKTFAEICEGLNQWHQEEEIAPFAVNLLIRWIDEGMVTSIRKCLQTSPQSHLLQ